MPLAPRLPQAHREGAYPASSQSRASPIDLKTRTLWPRASAQAENMRENPKVRSLDATIARFDPAGTDELLESEEIALLFSLRSDTGVRR